MVVERQHLPERISIPRGLTAHDYNQASNAKTKIRMTRLLRPYWQLLAIAFVALLVEGAADLLEPWPLKIIFDNVIGSKQMPSRLAHLVKATVGLDKGRPVPGSTRMYEPAIKQTPLPYVVQSVEGNESGRTLDRSESLSNSE